jgi:hypothetical protein
MIGTLVRNPPVGVAHLGGLPPSEPATSASVSVEHHRGNVVQRVLGSPGTGIDDRGGAGHNDHGDSAVVPLEPPIYVVGLPGTGLLVFGEAHAELGGQADEVRVAGASLAIADIDQAQAQGPANGRVGTIDDTRSHGCGTDVEPGFLGDGAVHQD